MTQNTLQLITRVVESMTQFERPFEFVATDAAGHFITAREDADGELVITAASSFGPHCQSAGCKPRQFIFPVQIRVFDAVGRYRTMNLTSECFEPAEICA